MTEPHEPVSLAEERARRRPTDAPKTLSPQVIADLLRFSGNAPSPEQASQAPAASDRFERPPIARERAGDGRRGSRASAEPLADDDVRERAVRMLARSALSVSTLRSKLTALGASGDAVDRELERLVREGALDDAAMADALTTRLVTQGRSTVAIRRALTSKGIGRSEIDEALAAHADSDRDQRQANEFAAQRVERLASRRGAIDRPAVTRQLMGMLARRGFTGSVAHAAIEAALDSHIGE